jgi:hypothetical protein
MRAIYFLTLLCFWCLFSCSEKPVENGLPNVELSQILSADNLHMEEPFLFSTKDGKTHLSWIEKTDQTNYLKFSSWDGNVWSEAALIAQGDDWFVNWADYPQISSFEDGTLIAFFLQKSGPGTFAYDIMTTTSKNGTDWTVPSKLHDDQTQTEHGFVSMTPWGENMLISWLDGRNTGSGHTGHDHGHQGQMTVRAALLDSKGTKISDWELDERVCDCCQTSSTMTDEGPIIVFRDRSETEIRDLGLVKWEEQNWSETFPVHMDLWEIAACPVNGPKISAWKNHVGVVWYSAANDRPEVKVAFSENNGKNFAPPIKIDLGKTIGRVSIAMINQETAFVTWMEEGKIMGRKVTSQGRLGNPIVIAQSSEKRSSGFPQLSYDGKNIWLVWTEDSEEWRKIKVSKIKIENILGSVDS